MRFGVCASPDKLPLLAAAGYDYFEFKFSKLTAMSEDEFAEWFNEYLGEDVIDENTEISVI